MHVSYSSYFPSHQCAHTHVIFPIYVYMYLLLCKLLLRCPHNIMTENKKGSFPSFLHIRNKLGGDSLRQRSFAVDFSVRAWIQKGSICWEWLGRMTPLPLFYLAQTFTVVVSKTFLLETFRCQLLNDLSDSTPPLQNP